MSSRVLIPMLCVGAVVFACGPRAHEEASALQSGAAIAATTTRTDKPAAKKDTRVSGHLYVRANASTIRLALNVVNNTKKTVEITFPSGQTHDFVVVDSVGREMWRWAEGRMFTQTLRNRLLSSGEELNIEETWRTATLPPGTYTARATLKSQNYPIVQQTQFVVRETAIAAR